MEGRRSLIIIIAIAAGLWYFNSNYRLDGLQQLKVTPRQLGGSTASPSDSFSLGSIPTFLTSTSPSTLSATGSSFSTSSVTAPRIRVASFCLAGFGQTHLNKPHVMERLVAILRSFDVVAIQGIRSRQQDVLPRLVDAIRSSGRSMDYMIGPRVGRSGDWEQLAFIFATDRIETDRTQLYTVSDPLDVIDYEPLVGWFRVKGIAQREAFTFSLVNININPNFAAAEIKALPEIVRAIQKDGRGEDDIIIAGNLQGGMAELGPLLSNSGMLAALEGAPTDVMGQRALDNILFPLKATEEYTGYSGVVDFLRIYNLSLEQSLEISEHLPVWAEFFVNEGGQAGRIATPGMPNSIQ